MRRLKYRIVPISLAPVSAALLPGAAVANVGDIEMHTGVTVTHNATFRVESAGTTSTGANSDDGARHHGKGIAAEFKANAERLDILALTHGFVDFENQRRALNQISRTDGSRNVAGRVLDLCAATTVDAGNQVPNRGESTFLRNGVGVIDPFDVDLFRTPGQELHDGSVPVSMASILVPPPVSRSRVSTGSRGRRMKSAPASPNGAACSVSRHTPSMRTSALQRGGP